MPPKPLLTAAFTLIVTALAFARFDDTPAKPEGDLGKLQGKWTTKIGPNEGLDATITVSGKVVELKIVSPDGQDFDLKGEIKLDEKAKPHKTIDWTKFKTPNGDDLPENLGIYKFEDDNTVKVCTGGPSNARPEKFEAQDGGAQLSTMKRVVEKEKAAPKP